MSCEALMKKQVSLNRSMKIHWSESMVLWRTPDKNERRLILVGKTGHGKSSTGNSILGRVEFDAKNSFSAVTSKCELAQSPRNGKTLKVVDTPGLFDTAVPFLDRALQLREALKLAQPGPQVFLLVLKIGVRFSEEEKKVINMLKFIYGKNFLDHTVVVFTGRDQLDAGQEVETYIATNDNIVELLRNCGNRFVAIDNKNGPTIQTDVMSILTKIEDTLKSHNGRCFRPDPDEIVVPLLKECQGKFAHEADLTDQLEALMAQVKVRKQVMAGNIPMMLRFFLFLMSLAGFDISKIPAQDGFSHYSNTLQIIGNHAWEWGVEQKMHALKKVRDVWEGFSESVCIRIRKLPGGRVLSFLLSTYLNVIWRCTCLCCIPLNLILSFTVSKIVYLLKILFSALCSLLSYPVNAIRIRINKVLPKEINFKSFWTVIEGLFGLFAINVFLLFHWIKSLFSRGTSWTYLSPRKNGVRNPCINKVC